MVGARQPRFQAAQCFAQLGEQRFGFVGIGVVDQQQAVLGVENGFGAAAFGAGKLAASAGRNTTRSAQDNIQGWKDANAGKPGKPGGELGYNASKARKYAIEQMIARNEARRLAQSRESAVKKFNS